MRDDLDEHNPNSDVVRVTARADAAASHASEDSAYALTKSVQVFDIANTSVMYCYAAVAIGFVMAGVGVVNGWVDLKCTNRDDEEIDESVKTLEESGWPAYRRRWAQQNPDSLSGGNQSGTQSSTPATE